jgi:hypothetical protein
VNNVRTGELHQRLQLRCGVLVETVFIIGQGSNEIDDLDMDAGGGEHGGQWARSWTHRRDAVAKGVECGNEVIEVPFSTADRTVADDLQNSQWAALCALARPVCGQPMVVSWRGGHQNRPAGQIAKSWTGNNAASSP